MLPKLWCVCAKVLALGWSWGSAMLRRCFRAWIPHLRFPLPRAGAFFAIAAGCAT